MKPSPGVVIDLLLQTLNSRVPEVSRISHLLARMPGPCDFGASALARRMSEQLVKLRLESRVSQQS